MHRVVGIFVLAAACLSGAAFAQAPAGLPSVPRFAIEPSPIGLVGDVRPHQFVGVEGRKAAWLGSETGEAELWVHPIKLASAFQLDFQIPDYVEPIKGSDVARTIEVRPELTTITYSHATFTVKEHILAPLDEPGLLVLLEVDTFRPLQIIVSFKTVFQYAWPGAFGGQYAGWDDSLKAFVLSESLRQRNGLIGSPWATTASNHPAHALPDAPSVFRIPVDAARARREFIPIAIAAGIAPRDQVVATYRRLLANAERLYHERRAHEDRLLAGAARLETPDPTIDRAYQWALVNLDEQTVCNPDLGCGLVAGWGPSGQGTRPGFGWFFGGDAAINSLAMSSSGLTAGVAQGLRFLAKYQRADGKITHEISQSAGRLPWFTEYPYAYYHADTTPYYIVAAWRYWRATGDEALLAELWPVLRKAYAWCLTTESDGDGLIENELGGLGAVEVGAISEGIHEDIYLASVWVEALHAMTELAAAEHDPALAGDARAMLEKASKTLNDKYWIEAAGHYAFGLLKGGKVNDALTVWPSTALAFDLLDRARGARTLEQMSEYRMSTDWGTRMLAKDHPLYGPLEYNMGAVWPFVTGFVALGHYNYGRPWAGYPLVHAVAGVAFDFARGRYPELLSGEYLPAARHGRAAAVLRRVHARHAAHARPGRLERRRARPPRAARAAAPARVAAGRGAWTGRGRDPRGRRAGAARRPSRRAPHLHRPRADPHLRAGPAAGRLVGRLHGGRQAGARRGRRRRAVGGRRARQRARAPWRSPGRAASSPRRPCATSSPATPAGRCASSTSGRSPAAGTSGWRGWPARPTRCGSTGRPSGAPAPARSRAATARSRACA